MKKIFIIGSLVVVIFGTFFLLFGTNVFGTWATYTNGTLGFTISHPKYMQVMESAGISESEVHFSFFEEGAGPGPDEFGNGLRFVIRKNNLGSRTFLDVEQELQLSAAEQVNVAGRIGFRYEQEEVGMWFIFPIAAANNQYFEVSYQLQDPNSQGYQQIAEEMTASFLVQERTYSAGAVILGIALVASLVAGLGLYVLMARRQ